MRTVTKILYCQNRKGLPEFVDGTEYTKIAPSAELYRTYIIQAKIDGRWKSIFEVKRSKLKNAGRGVFAKRNFKADDVIGVYVGEMHRDVLRKSEYAVEFKYPFNSKLQQDTIIDALTSSLLPLKNKDRTSLAFGSHMINDCNFQAQHWHHSTTIKTNETDDDTKTESFEKSSNSDSDYVSKQNTSLKYNVIMDENLVLYALCYIKKGNELYMNYNTKGDL